MAFSLTSLAKRLARYTGGRRRPEEIRRALGDAGYIDAEEWARINRISLKEAEKDMERGVKGAILKKMYLYEGSDSPVRFLVPETRLDKPLWLSEVGYFGGAQDRTITVSRFSTRAVYIDARSHGGG